MSKLQVEEVTKTTARANSNLACFGGTPTVTEPLPPWPCPNEDEVETVRRQLLGTGPYGRSMCVAGGGGTGEALEQRFKKEIKVPFAVATAAGGPALHIACMSVLEMGEEAITTPYSWGQTVSCIVQAGGVPIFADIDPETLTLDPALVESKVTPYTKAIVLAHICGIPADMDGIMDVARRHGLYVIEDCAQAQGSRYRGRPVGTFGDFGCFSMGSGKHIAAGEAGMLVMKEREMYERALLAGMHPARTGKEIEDPKRKKWIDSMIYTYRINAISAGLALKQMDRLEELNGWRRTNGAVLRERLRDMPGIRPQKMPQHLDPAWHLLPWSFVPDEVPGVTLHQYLAALKAEGVPVSQYVKTPIHLRPMFQHKTSHYGRGYPWKAHPQGDKIVYRQGDCPVAERHCAAYDIIIGSNRFYRPINAWLDQVEQAFRKVTERLDEVRELEV
ncbi:MAG: DegT/DnrJ/EryC1/StrS family aminotransferase [Kiritimatiellae bacterium]|nr:DegT/DnrJ/EryC1/StrS family aminotransferase [Kiritimatiellia bacterium]